MRRHKSLNLISLLLSLLILTACQPAVPKEGKGQNKDPKTAQVTYTSEQARSNENTMSVLWYQQADEAKALYLQGYQLATERLENILKTPSEKPYAIVLDIDETVLDNSPYQAQCVKDGTGFTPESWDNWVQMKAAKAVPGAKEFLQFADRNKVEIYYVSDRSTKQVDATKENLKAEGLPVQADDRFLFLEKNMSSKEGRRQKVQEKSNLVLLFGDNLLDFADFSKTSQDDRTAMLEKVKKEFGNKFIIFPNPMYGSWESAIYKGKHLDAKHQSQERHKALRGIK
ncbi:5'-nucleotidase, lipoprotein e(P4) family [Streptococcus catagoni]|uniref:5'-nucleotidase, lipoprotein e(P4) family n=1 Tax=Streptococcus catagoni TaxID=2654874 RepID=UPI0014082442|nr:5'-nucleotidase, lipoprotein e(P4) family [Streptococcus catagoni]